MNYQEVLEGSVQLKVPVSDIPEHARRLGFYNPEMKTDRNLSVCVLSAFAKIFESRFGRAPTTCDLLCATGARAVRYAKEVCLSVCANDSNENALDLARQNAQANNVEIEITNTDANMLLAERSFDIIDIDPFGSPFLFIDSVARAIGDYGLICITATDTATLFGVYPEVSERRYGIPSFTCDFSKELGTRILLSFVMRELAKHNKCFTPVLCYSRRHYVRLFGIVEKSAEKVEELMKNFNFLSVSGDSWRVGKEAMDKENFLGKLYLDPLKDGNFCSAALDQAKKRGFQAQRFLREMMNESDEIFYYESSAIARKFSLNMKLSDIIFAIARAGFPASRTSFSESAIKTSASWEDMERIFKV